MLNDFLSRGPAEWRDTMVLLVSQSRTEHPCWASGGFRSNRLPALLNNNLHFFSQHTWLSLFSPPCVFISRTSLDLPDLPPPTFSRLSLTFTFHRNLTPPSVPSLLLPSLHSPQLILLSQDLFQMSPPTDLCCQWGDSATLHEYRSTRGGWMRQRHHHKMAC